MAEHQYANSDPQALLVWVVPELEGTAVRAQLTLEPVFGGDDGKVLVLERRFPKDSVGKLEDFRVLADALARAIDQVVTGQQHFLPEDAATAP
jgi:hypothetical protein